MIGNLPQAAAFHNVFDHSANTLCTLCCMHRNRNHTCLGTNYSSKQHYGRLYQGCNDTRRKATQTCSQDKRILKKPEMETTLLSKEHSAVYLLPKFATITSWAPVPENDSNLPQESPQLAAIDHTLSVPELPNHLISIVTSSILKLCFERLETDGDRAIVEM